MKKKASVKKATGRKKATRGYIKSITPKMIEVNRRREWRLDLPLKTTIEGKLPDGKKFQEKTVIENISSTGAYFTLDSGLMIGSKLNLLIDLPEKLGEGSKLKLRIGGVTVRLEKLVNKGKLQGVAVKFSDDFEIFPA